MSEPIQSISQGNYILHNVDAKKLYVQEPLFTANSGDAVYVGIEPSAQYNETKLTSAIYSGHGTTILLSENYTNFEYLRVDFGVFSDEFANIENSTYWHPDICSYCGAFGFSRLPTNATIQFRETLVSAVNSTSLKIASYYKNNGQSTGATAAGGMVFSVYGINRKENA